MNYFLVRDDQLYGFLTNDFIIKTLENSHIMDKPEIQKLLYDAIEAENEKLSNMNEPETQEYFFNKIK